MEDYKLIYQKLGLNSRIDKLKEEIFELGQAACHFQDNKVKAGDLVEEMSDVSMLIYQIVDLMDAHKEFNNCIDYKRAKFCERFGNGDI